MTRCSGSSASYCAYPRLNLHGSDASAQASRLLAMPCPGYALSRGKPATVVTALKGLRGALREDKDGEGGSSLAELESWVSTASTAVPSAKRVCEIGLNRGHSAVTWLCTNPQAEYVGFDLARYNASLATQQFLQAAFPGRFRLIVGDTLVTLPKYAHEHGAACDVLSIDGGHDFAIALSDLSYMRLLARSGHTVVMDDLRCSQWWCRPPTSVWHYYREAGALNERGCVVAGCCSGWCWGQFNLSRPWADATPACGPESIRDTTNGRKCRIKTKTFADTWRQGGFPALA